MRERRTSIVIVVLCLVFGSIKNARASPATAKIRGLSSILISRQLNEGTEIEVRAKDKKDAKAEKEDDRNDEETVSPTFSPTDAPTTVPTSEPTTRSPTWIPTWVPSVTATQEPLITPTFWPSSEPSLISSSSPSEQVTPILTLEGSSSNAENPMPSSLPGTIDVEVGNTANDTIVPARPDPLATAPSQNSKSSTGLVVGLVLIAGSLASLGYSCFFIQRRQRKKNILEGETMPEEDEDEEAIHSLSPPISNMRWSEVFHHSLTNEEKVEVEPACTTRSLFHSFTIEEKDGEDDADEQEDAELSPSQQEIDTNQIESRTEVTKKDEAATDSTIDSYAQAVASLLSCDIIERDGEEKKCPDDCDMGSVTSEELEYLYGTLPSDLLPPTPRTSNVSPESKMEGSKRGLLPSSHNSKVLPTNYLLGPEMDEDGEECDLYWV
ncbi:hypothetical protein IV203_008598 [Nitzschia inconspicua]|uniref:Uncharacterized protein n=1 Tax=Nitzschia inconspicua TaxID=303405 RepID=A0A9K3KYT3_9STRA|nr:hypothetical protein IV203_008598 [Nitzschia inconspicua]